MIEEDIIFDKKQTTEVNNTQHEKKTTKRDYGNKYQRDRTTLSFKDDLIKDLDKIKEKKGIKQYPELLEYLIELENAVDPLLEKKIVCKKCGDTIDLPSNSINYQRIRHNDLNKPACNGTLCERLKIKKDLNGIVMIGNKLYHEHNEDKKSNKSYDCPFCKNGLKSEDGINFKCIGCNKEFEFDLKEKITIEHDEEQKNEPLIF